MGITTGFSPFIGSIGPLNRVTPFTHRDNATFLSILQDVIKYINTTLQDEITVELERILAEAQTVASNFDARSAEWQAFFDQFMVDVTANIATLNDLAIRDLINGHISETYGALNTLFTEKLAPVNASITAEATARADADTILTGSVNKRAYLDAAGLEYNEDFSTRDDGAFTTALTGQPFTFLGPAITVTDGYASFPNTSEGGAYASVKLDGDAVWLGGEFKMTPYTSNGGLVVFAMTEEDIKATQNAGEGLPRMSAHLCISPTEITLDVLTLKGTSVTRLWDHQFNTPLLSDDTQVYSAYICLNRSEGIAYIIDPYGEVHAVQHSGFKIPSPWVFFEPFRTLGGAATQTRAKFRTVQADSRDHSRSSIARALARRGTEQKVVVYQPGADSDQILSMTPTVLAGTLQTVTFPATGKIHATITAFIDITAAPDGAAYICVADAAGTILSKQAAGSAVAHSGWTTTKVTFVGEAGSLFTGQVAAYAAGGLTAVLKLGARAFDLNYAVTFKLEPTN